MGKLSYLLEELSKLDGAGFTPEGLNTIKELKQKDNLVTKYISPEEQRKNQLLDRQARNRRLIGTASVKGMSELTNKDNKYGNSSENSLAVVINFPSKSGKESLNSEESES